MCTDRTNVGHFVVAVSVSEGVMRQEARAWACKVCTRISRAVLARRRNFKGGLKALRCETPSGDRGRTVA